MSKHEPEKENIEAGDEQIEKTASPQDPLPTAAEFDALKKERDDLLARLQRLSADFANYQKRAARDVAAAHEYGNESLIKTILGVLDDLERAVEASAKTHDPKDPLVEGVKLVLRKAMDVLQKFGLTVIDSKGKPFDPELHQALMQQDSDEHPPKTVLNELQKGYQFKGRTIRPASVVVSKKADDKNKEKAKD